MAYDNTNRGLISANDRKTTDKHPDFKGQINVDGKEYWISGWNKTGTKGPFISLSVELKQAGAPTPAPAKTPAPAPKPAAQEPAPKFNEMDDDLPPF